MGDDDFALPVVRGGSAKGTADTGDDRAAESIAVRLTRDVFAVRELVNTLDQAVAALPGLLDRNSLEQAKRLAQLISKPLADARTALEKSTAAAITANVDTAAAIDRTTATIDRHASGLTNTLRAFTDAKGQIAEAATAAMRGQVDRYEAAVTRVEGRTGELLNSLHRARLTDLRELLIYAVIGLGVFGVVCVLVIATWEVFGKNIEKPYFCVGPDYTKCYSQLPHSLVYIDGVAPAAPAVASPSSVPVSGTHHRHRLK